MTVWNTVDFGVVDPQNIDSPPLNALLNAYIEVRHVLQAAMGNSIKCERVWLLSFSMRFSVNNHTVY